MNLLRWSSYLLLILSLSSCKAQPDPNNMPLPDPNQQVTPIRYLALGDSYTIGESVAETLRWPVQLANRLSVNDVPVYAPLIIARTGWTTNELNTGINNANPTGTYDLVSLLIGVNNQYRGYSLDNYKVEFAALLDRAIAFADGKNSRVFVVSIPDYGVTPFGQNRNPEKIARELDEFNAAAKAICLQKAVIFYDITPISRQAIDHPELVASDGLHPSGEMYLQWVELIYPGVFDMLK